jgi:hypothetical protein
MRRVARSQGCHERGRHLWRTEPRGALRIEIARRPAHQVAGRLADLDDKMMGNRSNWVTYPTANVLYPNEIEAGVGR